MKKILSVYIIVHTRCLVCCVYATNEYATLGGNVIVLCRSIAHARWVDVSRKIS